MNMQHLISTSGTDQHGESTLRLEDLPSPSTKRWVIRRKAEVVAGVRAGLLSLEEACHRYKLSIEEFRSWQQTIDRHGMRGLRTTRLQEYRDISRRGRLDATEKQAAQL